MACFSADAAAFFALASAALASFSACFSAFAFAFSAAFSSASAAAIAANAFSSACLAASASSAACFSLDFASAIAANSASTLSCFSASNASFSRCFFAFLRSASSFFCSLTYSGSGLTLTSHIKYTERRPTLTAPWNSPPARVGSKLSSKISLNLISPSSFASIILTPSSLPAWSCIVNLRPFSRSKKSTDLTFRLGVMLVMVMTSLLYIVSPGLTVLAGLRINGFSFAPAPSTNFGLEVVCSGSASSITPITLSRNSNSGTNKNNSKMKHSGKHHQARPSFSSSLPPSANFSQISPSVLVGSELVSSGSEPQLISSWSKNPSLSSSSSAVKLPV